MSGYLATTKSGTRKILVGVNYVDQQVRGKLTEIQENSKIAVILRSFDIVDERVEIRHIAWLLSPPTRFVNKTDHSSKPC